MPIARMIRREDVPDGDWVRHGHHAVPVTPLFADFEFGSHVPEGLTLAARQQAELTGVVPTTLLARRECIVVDGYPYRRNTERDATDAAAFEDEAPAPDQIVLNRWQTTVRPGVIRELQRFHAASLAERTDAELLVHIHALSRHLVEGQAIDSTNDFACKIVRWRAQRFCERYLGLREIEFLGLLAGYSDPTSAPVRAMEEIAERVRQNRAVINALESDDPWADTSVRDALAGFIEAYGHRTTDWEYARPTLAERPARVVALLREALAQPHHASGGAAVVRQTRENREAELADRLPDVERRQEFRLLLRAAQETYAIHEDTVNLYNLASGYLRYALLESGRRLARAGELADPNDVFFLRRPEVEAFLHEQRPVGLRTQAEARMAEYRRQLTTVAPVGLRGPGSSDEPAPATSELGTDLRGVGASPGEYTGPARVVMTEGEFESVRAGDVLVTAQTSPSWTILFGRIGALVTDEGGVLSHAAIAAREFGIPAALATTVATKTLRSGEIVTVNGSTGVVSRGRGT